MQPAEDESSFHVGQNLDILDSVNKWMNAEVLFAGNGTIFIHYTGWSYKYDESIPISSPRILKQWKPGQPIRLNNRIDAYHSMGGWLEARVIEIGEQTETSQPVRVHFFNYNKKYDMWVDLCDNNQVAIIGSRSRAYGMGKNRSKSYRAKLSELAQKILSGRIKELEENLREKHLIIKKSAGDGNCLFRSVSDQLYGTQEYHEIIRAVCMDYIQLEKPFFSDYIVEDIDEYIYTKRKDGEWGDDVEIQALSEIYARPIEIYVFGGKPIRTFHEENEHNVEPIRLAYLGACHYDSIKQQDRQQSALMETQCGEFERMFLGAYHENMGSIVRNRNIFSVSTRLEDAIGEHLQAEKREQVKIEDELGRALEISEREAILQEIENAELKQFQNEYEQEKIQEDLKKIEEKELEEAKNRSKEESKREHEIIAEPQIQKPYWFESLQAQGFSNKEIWFAIEVKGYDPDAVQNFLLDNIYL